MSMTPSPDGSRPPMCEHRAALGLAEDDLAQHRQRLAALTAWINNPAYDLGARQALARLLNLPAPRDGT